MIHLDSHSRTNNWGEGGRIYNSPEWDLRPTPVPWEERDHSGALNPEGGVWLVSPGRSRWWYQGTGRMLGKYKPRMSPLRKSKWKNSLRFSKAVAHYQNDKLPSHAHFLFFLSCLEETSDCFFFKSQLSSQDYLGSLPVIPWNSLPFNPFQKQAGENGRKRHFCHFW